MIQKDVSQSQLRKSSFLYSLSYDSSTFLSWSVYEVPYDPGGVVKVILKLFLPYKL